MRDSKTLGLLAAAALMAGVNGNPIAPVRRHADRERSPPTPKPRRYVDTSNTPEIQAWNRAVDERKAAKRAAKVRGG